MPARSGAELAVPRAGRPRRVRGSRGRCRTGAFWVASCWASPCLAARSGTGERSYHKKAKPGQGDALTCLRFSRFVPGSSFVNSLLIKISAWKQLAFWAPGFGAAHRSGHLGAPWRHSWSCRGGCRDTGPSHGSPAVPRSEPVLALWVSPPAWRGNPKSFLFLACGFSGLNVVVASSLRNDHF